MAGLKKSQRFGHWVWLVLRTCRACGQEHWIVAGDTRRRPSLPPGAILCSKCGEQVAL